MNLPIVLFFNKFKKKQKTNVAKKKGYPWDFESKLLLNINPQRAECPKRTLGVKCYVSVSNRAWRRGAWIAALYREHIYQGLFYNHCVFMRIQCIRWDTMTRGTILKFTSQQLTTQPRHYKYSHPANNSLEYLFAWRIPDWPLLHKLLFFIISIKIFPIHSCQKRCNKSIYFIT